MLLKKCKTASEYLDNVSNQLALEAIPKPQIKLSSTFVRLDEEYEAGSKIEEEKDIILFHKYTADMGDASAQFAMGILYLYGESGIEKDSAKALKYLNMALDNGDPEAGAYIGYMFQSGIEVEQNNATALEYYEDAAKENSGFALNQLGVLYLNGWSGITKDINSAKNYFKKSTDSGNPEGIYNLGKLYASGSGVTKNLPQAHLYFQRAAQAGNILALYNLARMQLDGSGVAASCTNAIQLYNKVLERSEFKNLVKDAFHDFTYGQIERALVKYELASVMGYELAQSNAAWIYEKQDIIQLYGKNDLTEAYRFKQAIKLCKLSGEQNSAKANLKLGDYFYYGKGVSENLEVSSIYYRAASDLRDPQATFNLGYMHQKGLGLPKDLHLAKRYYDLAFEYNPEAYIASHIAISTLIFEDAMDYFNKGGFLFGIESDILVLVVLSISLIFIILFRVLLMVVPVN